MIRAAARLLMARFHLGFRPAFLVLAGVVAIVYGAGIIVAAGSNQAAIHWWPGSLRSLAGVPVLTWGVIWCCTGSFLLGSLWSRSAMNRVQFAVAAALNGVWAVLAIQRAVSSGEPGSWAVAAIYAGIAAAILLVSSWPEPVVEVITGEAVVRAEAVKNGEEA